jgi:hypothetical protein
MEKGRIPKKILTYNPRRRRGIGRPQLRWRTSILYKRMERAKYGLILEDDDDDLTIWQDRENCDAIYSMYQLRQKRILSQNTPRKFICGIWR